MTCGSLIFSVLSVAVIAVNLVDGQQDRRQARTNICAPLSLAECEQVAQTCLDLTLALRKVFSSQSTALSCAGDQGIGWLSLWWANSDDKTNAEILRDAGADDNTAREITRCVLNTNGWAVNNVLDTVKVQKAVRTEISKGITKPSQQAATLAALDTCRQPTIDTMRDYTLCIAKACIAGR